MKIVIIDYGMGNIKSIVSAVNYLGVNAVDVSRDREEIYLADKIILPGVGSFSKAMKNILKYNIDSFLEECVLSKKTPILGICLGMQLLVKHSDEDGNTEGLSFVDAVVDKIKGENLIVPHVGFDQVKVHGNSRLYHNIDDNSDFYFTHSYKVTSSNNIGQSYCVYGGEFIASYEQANIAGVQFHPELSQKNGLQLLDNFIKLF